MKLAKVRFGALNLAGVSIPVDVRNLSPNVTTTSGNISEMVQYMVKIGYYRPLTESRKCSLLVGTMLMTLSEL